MVHRLAAGWFHPRGIRHSVTVPAYLSRESDGPLGKASPCLAHETGSVSTPLSRSLIAHAAVKRWKVAAVTPLYLPMIGLAIALTWGGDPEVMLQAQVRIVLRGWSGD